MNCFELVGDVLDEHWDKLNGDESSKRQEVSACQMQLTRQYSSLREASKPIDYKDPATRYAYIRCYVTSHANLVTTLIKSSPELKKLFRQERVKATCIGGGPGSDLLGILKYIEDSALDVFLKIYLYDGEKSWSDSWCDVEEKLEKSISTYFEQFDVTMPASYSQNTKYLNSDLFTMIYFISEIYHCREKASRFFDNLFAKAKPGSLFLFVDNAHHDFYDWFDSLHAPHRLEKIESADSVNLGIPSSEEKKDLGLHLQRISSTPKLNAKVAYRILRKPADTCKQDD